MSVAITKIIRNTSGSDKQVLRRSLADGESYEIPYHLWLELADSDSIATDVTSGDLVVNDGTSDLSVTEGLELIQRFHFDYAGKVAFDNSTNGFNSTEVQSAIEEARTGFEGKGFQTSFVENGTARNTWIKLEDANIPSDESPYIFKYQSRLVGIDFTNSNRNVDCIVKIAIRRHPYSNLTSMDETWKWTINNGRMAIKTDQINGFVMNPGDAMAVYIEDNGGNAKDVVITMDFIITSAAAKNIQTNPSGDFQSNDFPATGSMQEIFT